MMEHPEPQATPSPFDALGDPRTLVAILWEGRRLIAAGVLGCLAISAVYLALTSRLYQASAKLLVLEGGASPLSTPNGPNRLLATGAEDSIPTHAAIVSSPVVVRRALETIGLNNLPSIGANVPMETAVLEVTDGLSILRPDRQAKILQVAYRSRSREEAIRVVGAVADSYQKLLEEVSAKGNGEVVGLMTRARDDLNRELKELEARYMEFRQRSLNLAGDGAGRTFVAQRLDEWNRASRETMVRAVQLKAQLELGRELSKQNVGLWSIAYAMDQMAGGAGNGLAARAQVNAPAAPSEYLRQLAAEQQKYADTLGPQSTKVREIHEQITQAQSNVRKARAEIERAEVDELLASVGKSLNALETMRGEIQTRFETDLAKAKEAEIDQLAEANLKNELERHRKLFDTVMDQLKQAKLVGDFSGTRAFVIEPPNALPKPVKPVMSMTVMMAIAAGLSIGLAAAVGAELVVPRVRSTGELRRMLRLPVLGQVPFVPEAQRPPTGSIGLICETMPRSPTAEAFRVVRANLDLARRGREARVVLVTAPSTGDGKSTVASNLAVALAQAGRDVALVDADLRTSSLHETFGLSRERGFSHMIRDLLPLGRVAQATRVANLDLIAGGPEVPNPAELLSSPELPQVLDRLRKDYDVVVVDTPPLLAYADASILGAVADAVVLVVRVGATRRADSMRAVEVLKGLGTPVVGLVVNGSTPETPATHWSRGPAQWLGVENGEARGEPRGPVVDTPPAELPYDPQMTFGGGGDGALWYSAQGAFRPNPPASANGDGGPR